MAVKDKLAFIKSILSNKMLTPTEQFDRIKQECNSFENTERKNIYKIEEIAIRILRYFQITDEQLQSKTRKQNIVLARQIGHYLSSIYTRESLGTIGNHFGGKTHSTVISSINKIESYRRVDKRFVLLHEDFINSFRK